MASVSSLWRFLEGLSEMMSVSCESDESRDDCCNRSEDAAVETDSSHVWRSKRKIK